MLEAAVAHALNGPFLRAAWGESTPRAPIWIMRQAGRYLPEYRALKERSSFLEMVRTPALAAEITLQPIKRFPLDAAIVFSDIMTPLEALGIEIAFSPGPHVAEPLRSAARIAALRTPEDGEIAPFVGEALRLVRADLPADVALIGFAVSRRGQRFERIRTLPRLPARRTRRVARAARKVDRADDRLFEDADRLGRAGRTALRLLGRVARSAHLS
jgi:hypothetical protein